MAAPTLPGASAFPYVSPGVGFPAPVPTTATDATGSFDTQTVDSKTFICVPYESRNEKYFMEGSILFTNHARTKERLLRRMVVIADICMMNELLRKETTTNALGMFKKNPGPPGQALTVATAFEYENVAAHLLEPLHTEYRNPTYTKYMILAVLKMIKVDTHYNRFQTKMSNDFDYGYVRSGDSGTQITPHWTLPTVPPEVICNFEQLLEWNFLGIQNKSMQGTGVAHRGTDTIDTSIGVDMIGCTKVKNIWGHVRNGDCLYIGLRSQPDTSNLSFKGQPIITQPNDKGFVAQIFGYTDHSKPNEFFVPLSCLGYVRYATGPAPSKATINQALYSTNVYRRLPWVHISIRV